MRGFSFIILLICSLLACKKNKEAPVVPQPVSVVYKDAAATNFFRRSTGLVAGDVALSIPVADNKFLWLFGDSYIDTYDAASGTVPCLFQVNNAGLLHSRNDYTNATTVLGNSAGIKSLFKLWPDGTGKQLWPGHGYQLGDTIYVYLQGIQITGGGSFGFSITGQDYMAKIKYPEMTVTGYTSLPYMDSVFFGGAMIKDDASGYVYSYGVKQDGLGSKVYVARFVAARPLDAWQFWDGSNWVNNQAAKAVIANGYSYNVNVCKIKNKYVLLSSYFSVGCDQGHEVHSKTADNPYGPFTNDRKLFDITDSLGGHIPFFYYPAAHPEYINAQNELLVTYCINGYEPCIPACTGGRRNPDTYRPRAMRVPLQLIDAGL
jgi:hypothetical protein